MSWNPFKRRGTAAAQDQNTSDGVSPPGSLSTSPVNTGEEQSTMATETAKKKSETPPPPPITDEEEKKSEDGAAEEEPKKNKPEDGEMEKSASISALKAAFPGDPAFCLDAAEKGWSIQRAKAERHDRLAAEHEKLKKSVAKLGDEGQGHAGVSAADSKAASRVHGGTERAARSLPSDPYLAAVETAMREKNISRGEATRLVNREQPELRHAYAGAARA